MRYILTVIYAFIFMLSVFSFALILLYYISILQYINSIEQEGRMPIRDIDLIPANGRSIKHQMVSAGTLRRLGKGTQKTSPNMEAWGYR